MADSRHKASDAEVLRLRTLHEVERMSIAQVVMANPQHGKQWVRDVLGYVTRKKAGRPVKRDV